MLRLTITSAAVALLLVACDAGAPPAPTKIENGLRLTFSLAEGSPEAAAAVMQKRLHAAKVKGIAKAEGATIVVDLAGADHEAIYRARELITRTGKLDLKLVDDTSEFMKTLGMRYRKENDPTLNASPNGPRVTAPLAGDYGIRFDTEQWHGLDGLPHVDAYLTAADREETVEIETARKLGCFQVDRRDTTTGQVRCRVTGRQVIERFLVELAAAEQIEPPADHQLVYQYIAGGEGYWRSYYAQRGTKLDNAAIANASSSGATEVLVTLRAEAARAFGEFTRANVSRKLVVLLDDRVVNAPIVTSPVVNGRMYVTLSEDAKPDDARELAFVLDSGPLPGPVREETAAELKNGKVVAPPVE